MLNSILKFQSQLFREIFSRIFHFANNFNFTDGHKMKLFYTVSWLVLVSFCLAWTKEDYEIFGLNDKVTHDLGEGSTFYSWLDLDRSATVQEISKAYRRKSRQLHPDKVGGSSKSARKTAEERFQRLSLVGNILRDQSLKRRYDYFLDKGFPKWKGTGYYYSKFRPGLVLTVFMLYILVGVLQWVALKISRSQDYKRIVNLKTDLKNLAWGGSAVPPADGSDRKIQNDANGKEFIVSALGEIFLVHDGERILIDENDVNVNPSIKESVLVTLPVYLWNISLGKVLGIIDLSPPPKPVSESEPQEIKKKKKKGERIELPNGKVVYGRPNARKRK